MDLRHLRDRLRIAREYHVETWAAVTLIGWSKYVYYVEPADFEHGNYSTAVRVAPAGEWVLLTFVLGCVLLLSLLIECRWPRVVACAAASAAFFCLGSSLLFSPARPPGWIVYAGWGLACADAALRGPRRMRIL